jgi:hypothetical protein
MKRPRQVISKIRFCSESIEQDDEDIVPSFTWIAELRGYCCTAMSSSLLWFMIMMPPALFGSEGLTGDGKPWSVKRIEMALAYPTKVAARSPSLFV